MNRIPVRFTRVCDPYWNEKPVAIVGGGPSLQGFDFERLRDRFHVLAVNGSILDLPWADAGFSLDQLAIRNWWPRFCSLDMPLHFAVPLPWLKGVDQRPTPNMSFYWRAQRNTFQRYHGQIACGGTSGFGALNLAWLKRARKIILLGFDYGARNGAWHHNEHQYHFSYRQVDAKWQQWAWNFHKAAARLQTDGVQVINASPHSRIEAFPRMTIDEALA
jgi:hypothetical protein